MAVIMPTLWSISWPVSIQPNAQAHSQLAVTGISWRPAVTQMEVLMQSGRCIQTIVSLTVTVCLAGQLTSRLSAAEDSIVEFIDTQLAASWADNEVEPSEESSDAEWLRRVYLDIAGRIPSVTELNEWLADEGPRRKPVLIDQLLQSPDYVRHFTTIWTNECIGRGTPRRVSRKAMEKFFREAFAKNRPWNDVVYDLVTAEGHFEENGAVNYILAQTQMPDEAVQLTAKTTRLFLGIQVQCTQCHNHPFNDWQQNQFWEFNSFFRQVRRIDRRRQDPNSGRLVDDYSEVVRQDFTGPVYFEKRSGLMQVAFPRVNGQQVDPDSDDRRGELGRLLNQPSQGQTPLIALAFVNRMWAHFFGYGFTRPVDDMGPHNPASHPELLERLAADFVREKYDVRKLIGWIANSRAYSLSSQFDSQDSIDDPAAGEMPLFSHAYLKSMEAEQLYDSLIVATNAHQSGRAGWEDQEAQRRRWMQQFVVAFDNDENAEATTFNGTIPQALMLMNSDLTETAVNAQPGSFLHEVLSSQDNDAKKVQKLYMAALSRMPTRSELAKARKLFRGYGADGQVAAFQDLFWALLNSNEFIFIH
jgi:hypothetical protein